MQRLIMTLMGLAALTVGCASPAESPASVSPSATPAISSSPVPSVKPTSVLEGSWSTGTVTESDINATLEAAGLGQWIEPLNVTIPPHDPPAALQTFILEIHGGNWDLYWEGGSGIPQDLDTGAHYQLDGQRVVVSHGGDSSTYGWAVATDGLTLTWLDTTYAPYKGIPEQVFDTAFYTSSEFQRKN